MNCVKCKKTIGQGDDYNKTVIGPLCQQCFKDIAANAPDDNTYCLRCKKHLKKGETCFIVDGNTYCSDCFFADPSNDKQNQSAFVLNASPDHRISEIINISGYVIFALGIIAGFSLLLLSGEAIQGASVMAGSFVTCMLILGFSKLVRAAECYLWKNKQ